MTAYSFNGKPGTSRTGLPRAAVGRGAGGLRQVGIARPLVLVRQPTAAQAHGDLPSTPPVLVLLVDAPTEVLSEHDFDLDLELAAGLDLGTDLDNDLDSGLDELDAEFDGTDATEDRPAAQDGEGAVAVLTEEREVARPAPDDPAAEVWNLVERAQGGDTSAFGMIYDRYVETVFRFVYFRVGNRQLAEDLTSDTFLRALKRIGSFTWQGRDLGAWLVTIARNLVADHFKSGRYRLEMTTGDPLDADREDRGPEGSPEMAVVDHITNVALLSAVKQLNPEQQECIVLRFLQGFSVAETAQAMGKNDGAIKALQYRAVRALARLLPDGFQP